MTELDLELPGVASELISEFGKLVNFGEVSNLVYDPVTGETTGSNIPTISVKAIVEPDKGQGIRAGLIESADFKLIVAANDLNSMPTTEDKVSFDGGNYKIVLVKPVYSGELVAIYEIWITSL